MLKNFLIKHNIIKGRFYIESFVYVDERSKVPVDMSDCVKWLMPFEITCLYKNKDKVAFQMLEDRYPEYKGFINLF